MGRLRAGAILGTFVLLTLPLMPVQAWNLSFRTKHARTLPNWYHKRLCGLLGLRLIIDGSVVRDQPVLLVANHCSWLDIPVLSAVAPVSFVAKKEVGSWPFVATLAWLQRTVFVDRERRVEVAGTAGEMISRLAAGDAIVLFAEGTSSDGNRVLPFRTSLFAAAKPPAKIAIAPADTQVQTVSLAYMRLHGVPLSRGDRPRVSWYGDMEMLGHAWELLKAGPIDVVIRIGPPAPLDSFTDRKDLARRNEADVREAVVKALRGRRADEQVEIARHSGGSGGVAMRPRQTPGSRWT